jgi:hypothetical protein
VLAWRFHIDRDLDERHSCRSGAILAAWQIADILTRPPTAWEFVASYSDLDYWQPLLNHWDFGHLPEADYQIGATRYVTFGHDWRRVGVSDWLERTAARELGEQVSVQSTQPASTLSQEEFAASVKQALRSLHQPQTLRYTLCLARASFRWRSGSTPMIGPTRFSRVSFSALPRFSNPIRERRAIIECWIAHTCGPHPHRRKQPSCLTFRSVPIAAIGTAVLRRSPSGCGTRT